MPGFLNRKPTISEGIVDALDGSYNEHEMAHMDRLGTRVQLDDGAILTTEGAPGREVIVILSGTANVLRDGEAIAIVGQGDVVGESAVITGEPRNATLIATTPVDIVVFNRREFAALLDACPRLDLEIEELVAARAA